MIDVERRTALEAIAAEVRVCTNCRLHETRTKAVPGEGDPDTEVVFVGEGPGEQEDKPGRPFVGASGELLTELIGSIGWQRGDVFITNVVKCRPPGNRDPLPDEISACSSYLHRQLEAIDPAVVVDPSGSTRSTASDPASGSAGRTARRRPIDPAIGASNAVAFAMYLASAFALYQASNKQTLVDDMKLLPAALIESRRRREAIAIVPDEPSTPDIGQANAAADVDPLDHLFLGRRPRSERQGPVWPPSALDEIYEGSRAPPCCCRCLDPRLPGQPGNW